LSTAGQLNYPSSGYWRRAETQCFDVKLSDLDITEEDLVKVFLQLLKAEFLEAKDLADEDPVLIQLMSPLLTRRVTDPFG
jgi:hypothetical protein